MPTSGSVFPFGREWWLSSVAGGKRMPCAARVARCTQRGESTRQHHGIDDLNNAVGLHHVADGDFGGITLGVDDPELAVLFLDCQRATLHCFQLRLAAPGLDAFTQVFGGEAAWHDV